MTLSTLRSGIEESISGHVDYFREMLGWYSDNPLEKKGLPYRDMESINALQALGAKLFYASTFGGTIHENLLSYIVGTGHTYKVEAANGANPSESDLKAAQEAVDQMLAYHDWPCVQEETYNRRFRSGENFDRLTPIGPIVDIERIEPHSLRPERDAPLGIRYENNDVRKPEIYVVSDATTTKPLKAWDRNAVVCHGKRGVDKNDPRGVPILWRAYCEVRSLDELHIGFDKVLASIFDHVIVYNYDQKASVAGMRAVAQGIDAARSVQADSGQLGNAGAVTHARNFAVEVNGGTFDAAAIVQAFNAQARRIGVLTGLPEFVVTGDADTGSRNSLLSAEGPATRRFAREAQSGSSYERLLLLHAIAARLGKFGDPVEFARIKATFNIVVKPPLAETQDKAAETNRVISAMREGVYSPQEAAQQLGVDYESMMSQREEHEQRLAQAREAVGLMLGRTAQEIDFLVNGAATLINAGVKPEDALSAFKLDAEIHLGIVKQQAAQMQQRPWQQQPPGQQRQTAAA